MFGASFVCLTLFAAQAFAITLAPCGKEEPDVYPLSRIAQNFLLPSGWRIAGEDRAAIYTRDEKHLHVGVYDKTERLQAVHNRFGWLDADRGPGMRTLRYTVDCEWLPAEMTCAVWRQLARFALVYTLAWLNVDERQRIGLRAVPRDEYLRDPTFVLELRFQDFDEPRASLHHVRYPVQSNGRQILGLGGKYSVDMNRHGKWYWRDIDKDMSVLRELTDSTFRRVYAESRTALLRPPWRACQSSFMLVLVHEVFHSFQIGHNNGLATSLMYHSSLGALRTPPGIPEYGGLVIEPTDILHLRNRWSRNNTRTPREMSSDFLGEFSRLMRGARETTTLLPQPLPPRNPLRPGPQIRARLLGIDPHDRTLDAALLARLEKQLRETRENDHRGHVTRKLFERQQVPELDGKLEWLWSRDEDLTGLLRVLSDYL